MDISSKIPSHFLRNDERHSIHQMQSHIIYRKECYHQLMKRMKRMKRMMMINDDEEDEEDERL